MQPRYFVGLTLPDKISFDISKVQRDLFVPGKVMEPLVPHITLLEPNSLQALSPIYLAPKLKEIADELLPIQIKLTGTGIFHHQILYISVESPELMKLQACLSALLPEKVQAQYSLGRAFVPHVTLVQAKPKQKLPTSLIQTFEDKIKHLLPATFHPTNLTQFTWERPRRYSIKTI